MKGISIKNLDANNWRRESTTVIGSFTDTVVNNVKNIDFVGDVKSMGNNVMDVVNTMDVLRLDQLWTRDGSSNDGEVFLEEIFKQEGIVTGATRFEEVTIPVKPGKYKIVVTNTSKNIFHAIKLSVDVTCDQFLDQTDEIGRGESWSTVLKAPFNVSQSSIKVNMMLGGNTQYRCRYTLQLYQQYVVTYQQTGVVAKGEENTYETPAMSPGQYHLIAKGMNGVAYNLSFACNSVIESDQEVKPGRVYKSKNILVMNEDKNISAAIRVTGTKPREVEFEVMMLQSVGPYEMKRLEDTERKQFIEQHKEMIDFAFESEELDQISLVCDIIQSRGEGFTSLLKYGKELRVLLSEILGLKKRAVDLAHSSDDIAEIKHVIEELDSCTAQTNLKCKVNYERALLQNAVQILEKEQVLVTSLEKNIGEGELKELEKLIHIAEDAMHADMVRSKSVKVLLNKAHSAVNDLKVLNQLSEKLDRVLLNKNKELITKVLREFKEKLTDYTRAFAASLMQRAEATLDRIEKSEKATQDLKRLVLSKQATNLGYYLSQNKQFIHPRLYDKANTVLHSLLQNNVVDVGQFLEEIAMLEEQEKKETEQQLKEYQASIQPKAKPKVTTESDSETDTESDETSEISSEDETDSDEELVFNSDRSSKYPQTKLDDQNLLDLLINEDAADTQPTPRNPANENDFDILAIVGEQYSDDEGEEQDLLKQMLEEDQKTVNDEKKVEEVMAVEEDPESEEEYSDVPDVELTDDEDDGDSTNKKTENEQHQVEEYDEYEESETSAIIAEPEKQTPELSSQIITEEATTEKSQESNDSITENELAALITKRNRNRSVRRSIVDVSQILKQQQQLVENQSTVPSSPQQEQKQSKKRVNILKNYLESETKSQSESSHDSSDGYDEGSSSPVIADQVPKVKLGPSEKIQRRSSVRSLSIHGKRPIIGSKTKMASSSSTLLSTSPVNTPITDTPVPVTSGQNEEPVKQEEVTSIEAKPVANSDAENSGENSDMKSGKKKGKKIKSSRKLEREERKKRLEEERLRLEQELRDKEALEQKKREEEEALKKQQEKDNLVQKLKESKSEEMVKKFQKGYVPVQFQRKVQLSHPLLDKLHLLLLQMIHANQNNVVTAETPFSLNVVKTLAEILTNKTKSKMFYRERTIYDIFKNFQLVEVQNAIKFFELREFTKKEADNTPSIVLLKFLLETGHFIPVFHKLMASDKYLDTCYDKIAIVSNKYYRDDLQSELMLLSQVKFDFGYMPRQRPKEETQPQNSTKNSSNQQPPDLAHLKQVSKALVQFFISKKTEQNDIDLTVLGDERVTKETGSLVRYHLCPALEKACHHGIRVKNFGAGNYHIWNVIESAALQLTRKSDRTEQETLFLSAVVLILKSVKIRDTDYLYKDLIMFTVFVCYSMNEKRLADYIEVCFSNPQILKDFYDTQSFLNDEERRKQLVSYLKPLSQLPFNLRV